MSRSYDRSNRPRRTNKASGARGWYDSPEWKTRSRAWLRANPICVRCPAKGDHLRPRPAGVCPPDRESGLRGPIQSICRPCHSANTMAGAHIDGSPATLEEAQTPVMKFYEELTAQLGGPSGPAVAVPGISSHDLAAQRTSHQKIAQVFVGADGHVNSIRLGGPRVTTSSWGVRAEVEVSRSGYLATTNEIDNPFAKFRIYQFPAATNQALSGCFIPAIREKGAKRALALLSTDEALAAEFQAIHDQCRAPWWGPDLLWAKAWCRSANGLEHDAPAAASAALAHAA